jgi:hypothetical protein
VPVLALAARRWPGLLPWVAGVAMIGAGLFEVASPDSQPGHGGGSFSVWSQELAALALAAVVAGLSVSLAIRHRQKNQR